MHHFQMDAYMIILQTYVAVRVYLLFSSARCTYTRIFSSRTFAVIACNGALSRELYASLIWPLINFMDWRTCSLFPFVGIVYVMILSRSSPGPVCLSWLSVLQAIHFSSLYLSMRLFFFVFFFGCLFNNCLSFGVSACVFFFSLFLYFGVHMDINLHWLYAFQGHQLFGFIFHHKYSHSFSFIFFLF